MPASLPLLLEIGAEELPSSFVDAALTALPKIVADELAKARLSHGEVRALGTPRRLSVLVRGVATRQLDLDEEVIGPPGDARPSRTASRPRRRRRSRPSWACGVDVARPSSRSRPGPKQKAGRYVVGRRVEKGRPAMELLGGALERVVRGHPLPQVDALGRPRRRPSGGPCSGSSRCSATRWCACRSPAPRPGAPRAGHRFSSPATFEVKSADAYVAELRERHVLVDREERVRTMMERVDAAARAAGGTYDTEPMLVDENASLVEEPHVVTGTFDRAFLALPAAVIRAVARGHQRYFCVQTTRGRALCRATSPSSTPPTGPTSSPREPTASCARACPTRASSGRRTRRRRSRRATTRLGGIVFHNRLGTVKEKVARIERLAAHIADRARPRRRAARPRSRAPRASASATWSRSWWASSRSSRGTWGARTRWPRTSRATWPTPSAITTGPSARRTTWRRATSRPPSRWPTASTPWPAASPWAWRRPARRIPSRCGARASARCARCSTAATRWPSPSWWASRTTGCEGKKLDLSQIETVAKIEEFATERLRGLIAERDEPPGGRRGARRGRPRRR